MLAEQNIPLVICVAYVAELVIYFPWKIEVTGLELVIQTTPNDFSKQSGTLSILEFGYFVVLNCFMS